MNCYDVTNQKPGSIRLVYCVKPGDTLINICELYYVNLHNVLLANEFLTKNEFVGGQPRDKSGSLIYPGDRIHLPGAQFVMRERRQSQRRKGERRDVSYPVPRGRRNVMGDDRRQS